MCMGFFYGVKMKRINLEGEFGWEITSEETLKMLEDAGGEDLDVHLASPGGSIFEGIKIFNNFRDYKRDYPESQNILTIKGLAASMASYFAMNPAFEMVAIEDNAVFMIHNAWGMTYGDYRDMNKFASLLEGLTDLLAQAYTKKTGKSQKEIRQLMDEETWYFGSEIKDAGFVDEIISTEEDKNKTSAIANAQLQFKNTVKKVRALETEIEDIDKIAAVLNVKEQNPALSRDNINQEVLNMTLKEFLEQNPAAKKEYEDELNAKFDAGVKSVRDRIEGAMVYIKPDSEYPAPIRSLAIQVVEGKVTNDSLSAAVATYDALVEKDKSKDAQDESEKTKDVKGQQIKELSDDFQKEGIIKSETDLMTIVNQHKAEIGMEA